MHGKMIKVIEEIVEEITTEVTGLELLKEMNGLTMEGKEVKLLATQKEEETHQHMQDQEELMPLPKEQEDLDRELGSKIIENQPEGLGINIETIEEEPRKFPTLG